MLQLCRNSYIVHPAEAPIETGSIRLHFENVDETAQKVKVCGLGEVKPI